MNSPDRRHCALDLEVEVPGTPEQVWEAIATGPGISAWLHPTRVEEHEGGAFSFDMGSGFSEPGTVTGWDPPHRFVTETSWRAGGDAGALATEWIVRARDGGTCAVRMVMSGFGEGETWDDELDGLAEGMRTALESLRLYLTHFAGWHGASLRAFGRASGTQQQAWRELLTTLGLDGVSSGEPADTNGPGVPRLAGVVEQVRPGVHRSDLLLRIDEPAPGLASIATYGASPWTEVHLSLFGDDTTGTATREESAWRAWMSEHFPTTAPGV
ncbi:MAG: SRPBCC domain-containing protein [Streptosporangiales bacterium]|nr:SRPBCC domain-containing protein [Streptosporangiales bacterium]